MNRFRVNLHSALFSLSWAKSYETGNKYDAENDALDGWTLDAAIVTANAVNKVDDISDEAKAVIEQHNRVELDYQKASLDLMSQQLWEVKETVTETSDQLQEFQSQIRWDTRRGNETMATWTESVDINKWNYEDLSRVLRSLARNKRVNLPWTNDEWKCSPRELWLATASAKVFQQLVDAWSLQQMKDLCKNYTGRTLSTQDAEQWKADLKINSNIKDIKSFYLSYKEYQSANSSYEHLKGLMWFFFEKGIETADDLVQSLSIQSKKITNTEISNIWNRLFRRVAGRQTYFDAYTRQEVDHRPSDWRQKASFEVIKTRLNSQENAWIAQSEKMLALLWDFNLDGELNSWDVGYKTGTQLADVFRRTVATKRIEDPEFDNDKAVQNLVAYAKRFGLNIPDEVSSVEWLYQWMTKFPEGYSNTTSLQNLIKNLPIDFGDVLRNWEGAWQESLAGILSAAGIEQWLEQQAAEAATQRVRDAIDANKAELEQAFPDEEVRRNVTQQLLTQLPWALVEQAVNQKWGLALWHEIPLDQIIKWSSIGFNIWVDSEWKPSFGLFAWWDKKWIDGKQDYSVAVDVGGNFKLQDFASFKWLFIPLATISAATWRDINQGQRESTLDATGLQRVELWGNIGVVALAWVPQLMWWAHVWYENDKQAGIESQAENIHSVIGKQAESRLQLLNSAKDTTPDFDQKAYLKTLLKQQYKNSSEESINTATDNIYSIIAHFKLDKDTTDDEIKTYARVVADVFAEQWRNEALAGIADNKVRISGWKVWVEFFNIKPALVLVAKFTKYHNARTVESDNSAIRRIDAKVNGTWNRIIDMWEARELWANQVSQINEVLKTYWAADNALRYVEGQDGKPGKVEVPASLVKWMWINVRVSQSLKWYVQSMMEKRPGGETFYFFPANAVYRLFQETGGNLKSVTLNIGSDKDNVDDIELWNVEWMNSLMGNEELMWEKRYEFVEGSGTITESWIDYRVDMFDELFTPEIVEWLKKIDSNNRRKFSEFMKTKRDAVNEFNDMVNAIKNVLWNNPRYRVIADKLSDPNTSNEDKQLIMDRIMAISAYANVHDKTWLELNIRERWNRYKESGERALKGPNWQSIFDKLKDVDRDEFRKGLDNYDPKLMPELIWTTAFYNQHNKAKWLALTWLGATTALWWKTETLSENDSREADKWFLWWEDESGNYIPWSLSKEKSPRERYNVKRAVKAKLPSWVNLEDADLKDLLKWKDKEFVLDNSWKKIKVKIGKEYVFYLMWECANESIGMKLNISIQEQTEVQDYRRWGLIVNDGEASNRVEVDRKDYNIWVAIGLENEEKQEEWWNATTTPETIELPDTTPDETGNPIDPNAPTPPTPPTPEPPVAPENPDWTTVSWWGRGE